MTALHCYAVTAPGLAAVAAAELRALGVESRVDAGGAAWRGDARSLYRANLWLRTATRVIVRVAAFRATTFWELERRAAKVDWAGLVRPGARVAFRVTARKSKLYHSDAVAQRLGEAVSRAVAGAQVVTASTEDREGEDRAPVQLFIARIAHDELTLSVDSSGMPLYQRGYRQAVGKAPLRETLAAATLLGAGWRGDAPVVDPFCGSGTIPLEAALIAGRIAPGLATAGRHPREYAFRGWLHFEPATWKDCVDDARSMAREISIPIRGSDRDPGAIEAARGNAARAGLEQEVGFDVASVSAFPVPDVPDGWIVTNPPYGQRVGDRDEVRRLYAAFGRTVLERASGWTVAMLSPDQRLDGVTASEAGRRFQERLKTSNGGIPVRLVVG